MGEIYVNFLPLEMYQAEGADLMQLKSSQFRQERESNWNKLESLLERVERLNGTLVVPV